VKSLCIVNDIDTYTEAETTVCATPGMQLFVPTSSDINTKVVNYLNNATQQMLWINGQRADQSQGSYISYDYSTDTYDLSVISTEPKSEFHSILCEYIDISKFFLSKQFNSIILISISIFFKQKS
jgi:hypothetical protein